MLYEKFNSSHQLNITRETLFQACVVETAARHHPGKIIQLMLTSPTINQSDPIYEVSKFYVV